MMTRRWMTVMTILLALAVIGSTGCLKKKKNPGFDPNAPFGDQVIIGYNADGTSIWGSAADAAALAGRNDSAEIAAGQFEAIRFDYDSPNLNPSEQGKIQAVVSYLQSNPAHGVIVEGHCDERGSNEYNLALSERRGLAVRSALIAGGVDGARVQTRGYGEERPAAFGHDEGSWSLNRRAEFTFTQM